MKMKSFVASVMVAGAVALAAAQQDTAIDADRPHVGTGPFVVAPGDVQIEAGAAWQRADDTLGLAGVVNGISGEHRRFLALGGDEGPEHVAIGPDGKLYVALNNFTGKQNALSLVHDDLAARNVFVRGVGHMSLPVDGRVVHEICTTLAHLDSDGTTVAVGATSIASSAGKSPTEPPTQNKGLAQRRARR